jgi:hypothetical protein
MVHRLSRPFGLARSRFRSVRTAGNDTGMNCAATGYQCLRTARRAGTRCGPTAGAATAGDVHELELDRYIHLHLVRRKAFANYSLQNRIENACAVSYCDEHDNTLSRVVTTHFKIYCVFKLRNKHYMLRHREELFAIIYSITTMSTQNRDIFCDAKAPSQAVE